MNCSHFAKQFAGYNVRIVHESARPHISAEHGVVRGYTTDELGVVVEFDGPWGWPKRTALADEVWTSAESRPNATYWSVALGSLVLSGGVAVAPMKPVKKEIPPYPHKCTSCGADALILATTIECTFYKCTYYKKR